MKQISMPASSSVTPATLVRCAIYTRVSTDDQARGEYNSLESQRDICEHAIAVHMHDSWKTTHRFDDPGFSGKNLDRPGMQALLQEVRAGQVDIVVAYKIDRITRSLPDFYSFWKVLSQHNVHFVSATQSFDTGTPMGMLMLNMLLSFGQFEREMIAERTQHKIAERAKKGLWNGGWAPVGYAHDPTTKQINPDPVEAPLARRIFELSKKLQSPAKVAAVLNAEGLRTPERKVQSRRGNEMVVGGKRFIPSKIKMIVTNPIYKGVVRHNGQDHAAQHTALVSEKLWQDANDALNRKKPVGRIRVERNMYETLLKGMIRCGVCGHRLTPKASGKKDKDGNPYIYYTCNEVSKEGKAAACPLRSVPSAPMDEFVLNILGEIGRHPEVIKSAIAASNQKKNKMIKPLTANLAKLQRRHTQTNDQLQRSLQLARTTDSGHLGKEALAGAEDLARQKHELEQEIEKLKIDIAYQERTVTDEKVIADTLLRFEDAVKVLSFKEQRELLHLLVRGIRVERLDPKKDSIPADSGAWPVQIRTQWYVLNLELFATDLVSRTYDSATLSSHWNQSGYPTWIRTMTKGSKGPCATVTPSGKRDFPSLAEK